MDNNTDTAQAVYGTDTLVHDLDEFSQVNIAPESESDTGDALESIITGAELREEILRSVVDYRTELTVRDVLSAVRNGQTGMAMLLARHIYKDRFASEGSGSKATFYKCDGGLWSPDERDEHRDADNEVAIILRRTLDALPNGDKAFEKDRESVVAMLKNIPSCSSFNTVIARATQGNFGCCVPAGRWDQDLLTLTTPEGIVDLKTGEVRELLPSDFRRRCTNTSLLPAECSVEPTLWLNTLRESFKPIGMPEKPDEGMLKEAKAGVEKEKRAYETRERVGFTLGDNDPLDDDSNVRRALTAKDKVQQEYAVSMREYEDRLARWKSGEYLEQTIGFLQRFLGYCLRGDNREQKFMIFVGDKGRNGKGIICHTLREILGVYADEARSEMFMKGRQKDSGSATPELMALQGKRIVIGSENDRGDALNASFIKRVTGGDHISGRMLYGNEQSFKPTFVPILLTNYFPHIDTEDQALLTRCLCLSFQRTFVEEPDPENPFQGKIDTQLESKLRAEYPAILEWIVQGAILYEQKGRLNVPEFLKATSNSYRESKDILGTFLQECCTDQPDSDAPDESVREEASRLYGAYAQWSDENGLKSMSKPTFKERMTSKGYEHRKRSSNFYIGIRLNETGMDLFRAFFDRKRPGCR